MNKRQSGVLIHPTSFPSPYGIGDLGPGAFQVLDRLQASGQTLLQVLPLGPTGYADAPFSPMSSFAGNPYLLSPDLLKEKGLLTDADLKAYPELDPVLVDFGGIYVHKMKLLYQAFLRFQTLPRPQGWQVWAEKNQQWLGDYARFMALKEHFGGAPWTQWPQDFRDKQASDWPGDTSHRAEFYTFLQWEFEVQWQAFLQGAHQRGIEILGDLPLYVAMDCADTWGRRDLFDLDPQGNPREVAGVPPDALNADGQLWGNPLYLWPRHQQENFAWWTLRITKLLSWVDAVKIDHFRGFEAFWAVPAGDSHARGGRWINPPGRQLFKTWEAALGKPMGQVFYAENLGHITEEVDQLLADFHLPGMQLFTFFFPWYRDELAYEPGKFPVKDYAYTSTHDTELLTEWLGKCRADHRARLAKAFQLDGGEAFHRQVIRALLQSPCQRVIIPFQDLLGLGGEHRMNKPGTLGNWRWRITEDLWAASEESFQFLKAESTQAKRN